MGGAVGSDQSRPVHGKAHRKRLDRHVVHDLVIGALQKGRIDGAEGPEALAGEPGGKGHPVLLGDADIEGALREIFRRRDQGPCPKASPP